MKWASSHDRTCKAPASAVEYTATVRMPSRLAVRAMRQAISPRLAIRTERNTQNHWVRIVPALASGGDGAGLSWTGPVAACGAVVPGPQTGSAGGAGAAGAAAFAGAGA